MWTAEHDEFPGTERFQIIRRLGAGGMGVVYEAYDHQRGIPVALKTLRRVNAQALYYFKNEFRALAELRHPNLISLYELFSEGGLWFFTMELLPGPRDFLEYVCGEAAADTPTTADPHPDQLTAGYTLSPRSSLPTGDYFQGGPSTAVIEAHRSLPRFSEARLRHALGGVARGLAALHAAGKVHRDVKPSNVMVTADDRVLLLDFGLVVDTGAEQGRSTLSKVVGTPVYMAPEQASELTVGPPADWYSFGVMLFESLVGQPPFSGHVTEILLQKIDKEPPPPRDFVPDVPGDLDALCAELLRIDPSQRPSGAALLGRLGVEAVSAPAAEVFVGRAAELDALRAAFTESRERLTSMVVVGASGLGKSALVRQFLEQAEQEKALLFSARCYEQESVPYKALDGIIDALSRHLLWMGKGAQALLRQEVALLGRLFPVLQRVPAVAKLSPPADAGALSPQELRARACDGLVGILRQLAESQPLILFIDDLHWADADSAPLLRAIALSEPAPRLLLLCTARTAAETGRAPEELAPPGTRLLMLGALAGEDAAQLTRRLAGALGVAPEEAAALAREAGGHPLFLDELVRYRAATGDSAALKLDDAIAARVARLPSDPRRLVELVAVLGEPVSFSVLNEAAGLLPAVGLRFVEELRGERLIRTSRGERGERVEPYHDRVREAVSARLHPAVRRAHAQRLADALEQADAAETSLALMRLLELAGDTEQAAVYAVRAAEQASEALAFDRAVELYKSALRLAGEDAPDAHALRLRVAESYTKAGRGPEAADAFLLAAEGQPLEERLGLTQQAAAQLLGSGHIPRGLQCLQMVLDELGEPPPGSAQESMSALLALRAQTEAAQFAFTPRAEEDLPWRVLLTLDVYRSLSLCLAFVDNIRGAEYQARALAAALEAGEPRRVAHALLVAAVYYAQEGEDGIAQARLLHATAAQIEAQLGSTDLPAYLTFTSAFLEYYEGRFYTAANLFKDAEEQFRDQAGTSWERSTCRLHRLRATDYRGAWGELAPLFYEYIEDARRRDDRYAEASLIRWFNVLWLARDEPDKAGADLDRSAWTPPSGGYHLQHFLEVRARVELALYRGTAADNPGWVRPALDDSAASFLFRIQIARAISNWLIGRLALVEAQVEAGERRELLLDEAAEMARRLAAEGVNYASVWSEFLAAAISYAREEYEIAQDLLRGVSEYADGQDLPLCAVIARYRLGECIGGAPGAAMTREALHWMRSQGIVNPARMCEIFAPGF